MCIVTFHMHGPKNMVQSFLSASRVGVFCMLSETWVDLIFESGIVVRETRVLRTFFPPSLPFYLPN